MTKAKVHVKKYQSYVEKKTGDRYQVLLIATNLEDHSKRHVIFKHESVNTNYVTDLDKFLETFELVERKFINDEELGETY